MTHRLPCLCCGARVIAERGAHEICPVCSWEDDPVQAKDPDFAGGANRLSLTQARAAWKRAGPPQ
ncbi:MAG TPA: CPCC family cysteine-rich protein [Rhizomicrobium sp.]